MAITTHEHGGHGDHGHDHEGAVGPHTHLTSVGIDIGSSTSHLMFSQLLIGYPVGVAAQADGAGTQRDRALADPADAIFRRLEHRGRTAQAIDRGQLLPKRDLTRDDIDTGAVIITGEAARRDNAAKIAELFADESGKFVCATAGPTLETIMAAHGSGAVQQSREQGMTLLNIDVGGGTTKISVIEAGRIRATTAVNIGARLVAHNGAEEIVRLEKGGRRFLADLGENLDYGGKSYRPNCARAWQIAWRERCSMRWPAATQPWDDFYVTAGLGVLPKIDGILFSGGVSEYIYARESDSFGDLGPFLGRAIRGEAEARGFRYSRSRRRHPRHGYRRFAIHGTVERRDDFRS